VRASRDDGTPVVSIAQARSGRVRVRGRLHVLSPVEAPFTGEPSGGYLQMRVRTEACRCRDGCRAVDEWLQLRSRLGRLAVSDATGLAVLDPAAGFEVSALDGTNDGPVRVVLREGMEVEVIGEVVAGSPDISSPVPSTYRANGSSRLLSAGRGEPGWIVVV
jgi:hypothetical protein